METTVTLARSDIFTVDHASPLAEEKRKKLFRRLVHERLYFSCRRRKDLQVDISFLSQRVKKCNQGDYAKFRHSLYYVHDTIEEMSTIGIEDIGAMRTSIDASHAVYDNMRIHTGGSFTFGICAFSDASAKQKLNTKNSTRDKVVRVSAFLPKLLYTKQFLES